MGGADGNREENPEGTTSDMTELQTLLIESQIATQSAIQQLGETLAGCMDALTTAITALVEQQNQLDMHAPAQQRLNPQQPQHIPPQQQFAQPPLPGHCHHQQYLPPQHQGQRRRR
ncbi:hypothetical protein Bca52824_001192 [Brassica carinata]|uniref:Uncharacterized protein n=1 Tax=Brassica carinata TaxID=52824 RepID=A0A8X8BDN0_BRACI|nr:hypothetical protein Bca52824_001192 [Brassica carinata]